MANAEANEREPRLLASYGRRRGRALKQTKQQLWDELLPRLQITLPEDRLNPAELFTSSSTVSLLPSDREAAHAEGEGEARGGASPITELSNRATARRLEAEGEGEARGGASPITEYWLEIGFGGGEHMAHQATLYPHAGIIGCEPYINGIAGLLAHIAANDTQNIRIFTEDARLLISKLPDASISKVFILYPDPWPKARHKKRRLVSTPTLSALARIMKSGAQLRLATDDDDYCTWMLERLLPHPEFIWNATSAADWLTPPPDWIRTRYEQKKAVNRGITPSYLNFTRR